MAVLLQFQRIKGDGPYPSGHCSALGMASQCLRDGHCSALGMALALTCKAQVQTPAWSLLRDDCGPDMQGLNESLPGNKDVWCVCCCS